MDLPSSKVSPPPEISASSSNQSPPGGDTSQRPLQLILPTSTYVAFLVKRLRPWRRPRRCQGRRHTAYQSSHHHQYPTNHSGLRGTSRNLCVRQTTPLNNIIIIIEYLKRRILRRNLVLKKGTMQHLLTSSIGVATAAAVRSSATIRMDIALFYCIGCVCNLLGSNSCPTYAKWSHATSFKHCPSMTYVVIPTKTHTICHCYQHHRHGRRFGLIGGYSRERKSR